MIRGRLWRNWYCGCCYCCISFVGCLVRFGDEQEAGDLGGQWVHPQLCVLIIVAAGFHRNIESLHRIRITSTLVFGRI